MCWDQSLKIHGLVGICLVGSSKLDALRMTQIFAVLNIVVLLGQDNGLILQVWHFLCSSFPAQRQSPI